MSSSGPSTFVEEGVAIAPTWLQGPTGQAIMLPMHVQYDALASAAEAAIYAGLPGVAPADALPWASADRQIDQGPNESDSHFTGRLSQWLPRSRYYGTPTGVLLALLGYTDPLYPIVRTVSSAYPAASTVSTSIWNTYSTGFDPFSTTQFVPTPPTRTLISPANWNWDGNSDPFYGVPGWWRAWVIVQSLAGSPWPQPTATFGSFRLGYTTTGGSGVYLNWAGSGTDAQSLAHLTRKWRAAHNTIPSVIVPYSTSLFSSSSAYGASTMPNGHYGHWGAILSSVAGHLGYTFSVVASGGYASVFTSFTPTVTASATYSTVYAPARTIGPASYIDGVP